MSGIENSHLTLHMPISSSFPKRLQPNGPKLYLKMKTTISFYFEANIYVFLLGMHKKQALENWHKHHGVNGLKKEAILTWILDLFPCVLK